MSPKNGALKECGHVIALCVDQVHTLQYASASTHTAHTA